MREALPNHKGLERWLQQVEEGLPGSTDGSDPGFTYVVRARNRYKIGFTKDLARRMSDLQVANADQIELVCSWVSLCANALEKELHVHFWHRRLRGEWFKLNKQEIITLRRWASKRHVPTYFGSDRELRMSAVGYPVDRVGKRA